MTAEIVLTWPGDFERAHKWIDACRDPKRLGSRVRFDGPQRTPDQNRKMWPMLTDISRQARIAVERGGSWVMIQRTPEWWKLWFMYQLKMEVEHVRDPYDPDGPAMFIADTSTSRLDKEAFSDLIELIYQFGARASVIWSDPNDVEAVRARAAMLAERERVKRSKGK